MSGKKKSREYWRKKAVTAAKKIVRIKANYTCAYCGKQEPTIRTHGSHVFAEGVYKNMSADLDNILCLCVYHHAVIPGRSTRGWNWHASPAEAIIWFQENYPERWETLKKRTQQVYKVNFERKYHELKEQLKELEE